MPYSFQNDPKFLQKMLRIIPKAQKLFLEVDEHKIAFEYFLNEILDLTESEYGFIGDVILDPNTNRPFLKTHSITNIAWDVETREFFQANYAKGLEFRNLKTLFGYVIKNEIVIISNNVKNDPRSSGIPSGHPPLNSFLGLPIKINDKMIAMVGLANRKDEYTNDLVEALEPILFSLSSFLSTLQIRKKNKEEEAEKNSLIEKFQKFSDIVPGMLYQYLLKPDGTGSFPYTSKGIEQIYKIKSEDISENVDILTSIIHPEDMNSVVESIIESANTLQPWQHEYRVLDQDLGVRWLLGRSKPEKNEDGSILWHGFVMDISDQRNYETEIIQSKL
ncbi:MAG: GAF domain-containing protein [Leptospiraceae bacterium]|nr:GAF domain-containing protein [Leptospiraceae bacterium]MCZ8345896.1 GAF domain-containing protein [Leptospiraceae bacterium]